MHRLELLIIAGAKEEDLCKKLGITHLQLRTQAHKTQAPLDYHRIPPSLQEEIRNKVGTNDWPRKKLATRYFLRMDEILACIYNSRGSIKPDLPYSEIKDLAELGYTYKTLANTFNTSTYHIKKIIKSNKIGRHGLTPAQYEMLIEDIVNLIPVKDIANRFNLSKQIVYRIRDKFIITPTRKELVKVNSQQIQKLSTQGYNQEEIAVKLNITQPTVSRHLRNS